MALALNYSQLSETQQLQVLHVEDNHSYSRLIEELLIDASPFRYKFSRCDKLNLAIEHMEKHHVDIVLLDLSLPDSDGIQSVNKIRRMFPNKPLIVLTGLANEEMGLDAVKLGAQDYLVKEGCSGSLLAKSITYSIERQKIDCKFRDQALTDELTVMPNRAAFMENVGKFISRCDRTKSNIALLYLDFDGFKQINDTFGHANGDLFLQKISNRLKNTIRSTDFCARLGGDEFAVIADLHLQEGGNAIPLAKKLLQNLRKPLILKSGNEIYPMCSIGLAVYEGRNNNLTQDTLIQAADEAMYRAKREGGNCYRFYDETLAHEYLQQSLQVVELRAAVRNKNLSVAFQPIVNSSDGVIAGLEALARWSNKNNEPVSPEVFIDLLEKNNMICEAGEHIFNMACKEFLNMKRRSNGKEWLSVNVSPVQLNSSEFVKHVCSVVTRAKLDYSWLVIEITENTLLSETDKVVKNIEELVSFGVKIAIDDFGTGYSSMKYLMELPADLIKIDRVFLKDIGEVSNQQITKGMVRLAQALNKKVIVEGVENIEATHFFNELNTDYLQGFYFSKPLNAEEVTQKYFTNS